MIRPAVTLFASLALAGCSVFGVRSGYEQPPYEVVERLGETLEVRRYAPRVAVEAQVEATDTRDGQGAAFRLLFDYISGANRTETGIAMTAPVETGPVETGSGEAGGTSEEIAMTAPVETARSADGQVRMRFFLPAAYDRNSAPAPLDPRLSIVAVPEQTFAVLRFSGFGREKAVMAKKKELLCGLEASSWRPASAPVAYFYHPPWTLPFFRRNEAVVAVAQ